MRKSIYSRIENVIEREKAIDSGGVLMQIHNVRSNQMISGETFYQKDSYITSTDQQQRKVTVSMGQSDEASRKDKAKQSGQARISGGTSAEQDGEINGATLELSDTALQMTLESLNNQLESADAAGQSMKDMAKIMTIATRIANGDHVPPQDERKLMEFNKELYMAAKAAAVLNENKKHKHYKSVDEEEENEEMNRQIRDLEYEQSEVQTESAGIDSEDNGDNE